MQGFFRKYRDWARIRTLSEDLNYYWRTYGEWSALLRSPAMHISIASTACAFLLGRTGDWATLCVSILPNLLGFSLGAMAIVLAFPTSKMFEVIAEGGRPDSFYIGLASRFVHFIFVQVLALLAAIVLPGTMPVAFDVMGFFLLSYALLTGAMVAIALFGVARLYNHPGAQ